MYNMLVVYNNIVPRVLKRAEKHEDEEDETQEEIEETESG